AVRVRKALVDLDVVSALVPLLSSAATEVVVSASGALFNAALGLAGAERIRSLDGALPLLLGKCGIAHADARVRANTAGILQNVAAHCDAAREQLAVAGALSALLDLATREAAETGDVNVVARCVSAINNLALLPANARALCAPGAGQEAQDAAQLADAQIGRTARSGLGSLLELLGSVEREDVLEDASLAVVQILRVEVDACAELVTLEGLPVVKSLMAHMDEELQLCAKSDVRTHAAALELALELPLVERLGSAAEEEVRHAIMAPL
ncbi:armadillo-type protein, partial [Pavlovales sp. CCMP2436]